MNKFLKKHIEGVCVIIILAIVITMGTACAVFPAYQEASVYNKHKSLDQPKASTWDAIWAEFRVTID
jgi:hypothetical protein